MLKDQLQKVKSTCSPSALIDENKIKRVLKKLAQALVKNTGLILEANEKDLAKMNVEDPRYDRLKLNPERIQAIAKDVEKIMDLKNPVGEILEEKIVPNGLHISKVRVPLGLVGVIYEARPNVTVDIFALCFKTGNACVLKGGSDAQASNEAIFQLIQDVLKEENVDPNCIHLLSGGREEVTELLQANEFIDVIIPRGSQSLIEFVRNHSRVPVIETGAGVVHTFFDESGDLEIAKKIILNAKTRRPSVCNSLDTLLIHRSRIQELPELVQPLLSHEVEIFADEESFHILKAYPKNLLHPSTPENFGTEFLSLKMSIKTVSNTEEAIEHINRFGSKHSEAILSSNPSTIELFMNSIDAAVIYSNASTAFTDGGQFGMGAEVGISTQKLHARGPMGLPELTTYKWLVKGNGQVRA